MNLSVRKKQIIDLTHPFDSSLPVWPGDPPPRFEPWSNLAEDGFHLQRFSLGEHSGTHLGAPSHFLPSGLSVEQIPLAQLTAPGIKIEMPFATAPLSIQQINQWESQYGAIAAGHWILVQTLWSRHWQTERYFDNEFPGVSLEAVRFLCASRKITGIGIDSPGVDGGRSTSYDANRCLAEYGALHLENLHQLELLPIDRFTLFIGALPIVNGSGSPCRVLAIWE